MNELFSEVFAEMTTPEMVFLGGLMILVGILLSRWPSYFRQKGREPRTVARSKSESSHALHHVEKPAEMQRWEVEMQEVARELLARLDSKMVVLEQMIRDADAATARLQAASGSLESPHQPTTPGPAASPTARQPIEPAHPADAFHAAYEPASSEDPRYRAIYALADQGLSRDVIARRVGTPAGEVDLILSLRGKK